MHETKCFKIIRGCLTILIFIVLQNCMTINYPDKEVKLSEDEFYFSEKNSNSFVMHFITNKDHLQINFEIINDKLYCLSITNDYEDNLNKWEYLVQGVFQKLFTLPEGKSWDWNWIDRN